MPYKILIVDDDKQVRLLFTDLFKKECHSVKSVASGEEAIGMLNKENFDVVLLDIRLKGMTGLDTLSKIKEKNAQVIVIMITGFGYDEELISKSWQMGCSGYLTKDSPIDQIMQNFNSFVAKAKGK